MEKLTLSTVKPMIEQGERKAQELGVPMVITIVDGGGNLIATHRMDDALLVSVDLSLNKAWTSVAFKQPTAALANTCANGRELFGINTSNSGRVIIFGGGIPLVSGNEFIGAVGVSGGTVSQDIEVAEAVADALVMA